MLMYRIVPEGSCPRCGHKQFLVREFQSHLYLTNRDGEVIDAKDEGGFCVGKCLNCKREYEMFQRQHSFIPLTPLRKLMYEYQPENLPKNEYNDPRIGNPMQR